MIVENFDQLSPDWFKARGAIPTASCFDQIITSTGKPSAQRKKYMYQLAGESMLGRKEKTYQSAAMTRGIELQPEAGEAYSFITGNEVKQAGLIYKDDKKRFACSPDGLIGDRGGLEIKCPSIAVHIEYLHKNTLPTAYVQQVQGSLYITGLGFWDFVSYYPGLPTLIVTVKPDDKFIKALAKELTSFCDKLDKITEQLKNG